MEKIIFFCLLFIFTSTTCISQHKIGIQGGLNLSKLNGDVEANTKYTSKPGLNVGAYFDFDLSKNIYLSLQPSFSQEGTKITHKLEDVYEPIDSIKIKLNYLSLPVLLKVTSSNEKFYALAGLETAKLLSSSQQAKEKASKPLETKIEPWNFSIQFGAGIRIPLGISTLIFEARYSQGLNNITEESIVDDLLPRVKSSSIKFLTGLEIPISTSKK